MTDDRVLAHFREQARFCVEYGSPFTAQLIDCFAADFEALGPVHALVAGWPTNPRADALALRLAGALHAAVLIGKDEALAQVYPRSPSMGELSAQRTEGVSPLALQGEAREATPLPSSLRDDTLPIEGRVISQMDAAWPIARAFLRCEQDWVGAFIRSPPQTNETRRSIALLAGFLAFANQWQGPIDMLELGASAGLNLNWDRFAYRTQSWSWGDQSAVVIDTDWRAPAPPDAHVRIRHRAGCDLNPLDVRDEAARLQLKSYIWPDQPERLQRFDGAVALALQHGQRVDRASADVWLAEKLATRARDAATLIYHSVFLQYPPKPVREAIVAAIHAAGARATADAPLAWVRLEPEAVTDGAENGLRFVVDLHTWPGGARRVLGYTDGHVRAVFGT